MSATEDRDYQEVSWEDIHQEVRKANPKLATIIDKISPNKKLSFIKARYAFGDLIIKDGIPQLPHTDGKIYPLSSSTFSSKIKDQLNYSQIPLAFSLDKASEIYITDAERVVPLKVFEPGKLFGTFETVNSMLGIESFSEWNVSSGCRSIFMLPKISENSGLKRLKLHYALTSETSTNFLSDHFYLFKQMSAHKNFSQQWTSNVIFFTKKWFSWKEGDPLWQEFKDYVFTQAWLQSPNAAQRAKFISFWRKSMELIAQRRIQAKTYLLDTIRHLFMVAVYNSVSFQPAHKSDLFAPMDGLKEAILNVYLLKKYIPTIMHSVQPGSDDHRPLYYSLALPTLLEGTPQSKYNATTLMLDLKQIKFLIETLSRQRNVNSLLSDNVFSYLHVEDDPSGEIKSSKLIPIEDDRFNEAAYKELEFCATSQFWRGCIRINFSKRIKL